jgi:hypothetical protein
VTEARAAKAPEIRAWIQSEAAKSVAESRAYIEQQLEALVQAANAFRADQFEVRAEGHDWSPLETLRHVTEWQWQVGEDVLHVSLMGERPGNPRPSFEGLDRDALVSKLSESTDSVWQHVSAADPESFLELRWEHPFLGEFEWREWYFFLGVHMYDHTGQLTAMKQALDA